MNKTRPIYLFTRVVAGLFVLGIAGSTMLLRSDGGFYRSLPPLVSDVSVSSELNDDYTVTLTANVTSPEQPRSYDDYHMWAALVGDDADLPAADSSDWMPVEDGAVSFDVHAGDYNLFTMDSYGNIGSTATGAIEINEIVDILLSTSNVYMPSVGGYYTITPALTVLGEMDETVTWSSSDPAVATVDDLGVVRTTGTPGTAVVTATTTNGLTASAEVVSTEQLVFPTINNRKQKLGFSTSFTEEEAAMLDAALFSRVEDAGGYGTRAGVAAAARFLALEFAWRVPYFYENGRLHLDEYTRYYCDGEGRFYHRGLYLSDSKYEILDPEGIRFGPAHWGAPLVNWEDAPDKGYVYGQLYPNGLDCSGFVTWCLMNGGVEVGDVGSGDYVWRDGELSDLGTREWITYDLMVSDRVKAGDLIGKDGHIAIVLGIDEDNIYIAESLYSGVIVATHSRRSSILYAYNYDYVMLMDEVYEEHGGQGNYTAMWPQPEPSAQPAV